MQVRNIGCIGPQGVRVALDDVVCIVGRNNSGKSTLLRAYELAQGKEKFDWGRDRFAQAPEDDPSEVILEVHIPPGIGNIGDDWVEEREELRILTSRWRWLSTDGSSPKAVRQTRKPGQPLEEDDGYAPEGNAGGADNVFKSRLPQPVRIESRGDPAKAEEELMKLVLEPVVTALDAARSNADSEMAKAVAALRAGVAGIVDEQKDRFGEAVEEVEKGLTGVFPGLSISLDVKAEPPTLNVAQLIKDGSGLRVTDGGVDVPLSQQGSGAQRALFWTMLRVRNKLDSDIKIRAEKLKSLEKEKTKAADQEAVQAQIDQLKAGGPILRDDDDPGLPGYILLIDEPENALHPLAVRAAQRQLYQLAAQPEWQVMVTTHSPLFVNPAVDHTTILRLEREEGEDNLGPRTFRTDEAGFTGEEKENLKAMQEMDPTFCEVFFGSYPIVVEGDTEHAAFIAAVVEEGHELIDQVTIIKARGKPQIRAVMKMLIHFEKDFGVLHDCDWPHVKDGKRNKSGEHTKSGSWAHNLEIRKLVNEAKAKRIRVAHEVSIPDFERRIGLPRGTGGKPFESYRAIRDDEAVRQAVQTLLGELKNPPARHGLGAAPECDAEPFMEKLLQQLRERAEANPDWDDRDRLGDDLPAQAAAPAS